MHCGTHAMGFEGMDTVRLLSFQSASYTCSDPRVSGKPQSRRIQTL
jgi:hypothetical protein